MSLYAARVPILAWGSGFCGLVYQLAWIRAVQPLFGSSSSSIAVVLAAFIGGMGLGGLFLASGEQGRVSALKRYSGFEFAIAMAAALSPFFISMLLSMSTITILSSIPLGIRSALRVGLVGLVVGIPAFLVGGTFPSLIRAGTMSDGTTDLGQTNRLFLLNMAGALCGIIGTNFFFLEALGSSVTLWLASVLNLGLSASAAVGAAAQGQSQIRVPSEENEEALLMDFSGPTKGERKKLEMKDSPDPASLESESAGVSVILVILVSTVLGFSYLLMELVWYRMLYPILGGTTYTFGMILGVALPCLGLGRMLQGMHVAKSMPSSTHVPALLSVAGLLLALPYALGDHIAMVALFLRPLADVGFWALVGGWLLVTSFVVAPFSFAVGYLFPLFLTRVALSGPEGAKHVTWAYLWNSIGSIVGAFVGGFGIFLWASAPEIWSWNIYAFLILAFLFLVSVPKMEWKPGFRAFILLLIFAAGIMSFMGGPTHAWRQGLASAEMGRRLLQGPNEVQDLLNRSRRGARWLGEGGEHQTMVTNTDGLSLYHHGRLLGDMWTHHSAETMTGILGGVAVAEPVRAMVVGLGSGVLVDALSSTASVRSVIVSESDEAALEAAKLFRPVNGDVLANPRVQISNQPVFDTLAQQNQTLDLIITRARDAFQSAAGGTHSLEFYQAAAERLSERGAFFQLVQAPDISPQELRIQALTLRSVFPAVEIWEVGCGKTLLFVARRRAHTYDIRRLRNLVSVPPYRTALSESWGVQGVEGLFTGFLASPGFADTLHLLELDPTETRERPALEFISARNRGAGKGLQIADLRSLVEDRGEAFPALDRGALNRPELIEARGVRALHENAEPYRNREQDEGVINRDRARRAYARGDLDAARINWMRQENPPQNARDLSMLGETLAVAGDNLVLSYARQVREENPLEADAILVQWFVVQVLMEKAFEHAKGTLRGLRHGRSFHRPLVIRALDKIQEIALRDRIRGREIYELLSEPFFMSILEEKRLRMRLELAFALDISELCVDALEPFEPHVPWDHRFLAQRYACYSGAEDSRVGKARADLEQFEGRSAPSLDRGLSP